MGPLAEEFPMKVTWPMAVLALGTMLIFFATVIVLTKLGVDAVQVMTTCVLLLVMVLGVLGWKNQEKIDTKIDRVQETSNGRMSDLIQQNRDLQEQNRELQQQVTALALRIQPPESL